MAAFSGFYESPGPPSSGNECGIAPSHHHGHRNGLQRRCFCLLSPPFLPDIIIAKDLSPVAAEKLAVRTLVAHGAPVL
jgi:hypothetical protein